MLLIDEKRNSAIVVGMLCNVKQRQTQSGKSFTTFSVITGTHQDEFDNWLNNFQPCVAYANLADYINELSHDKSRRKYLVAGTLRENTYQGKTELQIVAEYIAPQPQIETNTKQTKQKDPFDDCDI
jgi:Single-strand binding protein family.